MLRIQIHSIKKHNEFKLINILYKKNWTKIWIFKKNITQYDPCLCPSLIMFCVRTTIYYFSLSHSPNWINFFLSLCEARLSLSPALSPSRIWVRNPLGSVGSVSVLFCKVGHELSKWGSASIVPHVFFIKFGSWSAWALWSGSAF